ncbi:MAG: hypothetical protein U9R08_04460 [Nanoarchaeota archaeon]|nr:hypothetical protein [Nanoarchaeota archaeon]
MCFTPIISLSTAIIEFTLATLIIIFLKKSTTNKFFTILIILLGIYQFTEFMLCTSNNPIIWGILGYITYTFLPAVGVHFAVRFSKTKFKNWIIYIIPITLSSIAIFTTNFIKKSVCNTFFILVETILNKNLIYLWLYRTYYLTFIFIGGYILWKKYKIEKNLNKRRIHIIITSAVLIALIPSMILYAISPSLRIMFASVYCEFALLTAIIIFIGAYYENKIKKRK